MWTGQSTETHRWRWVGPVTPPGVADHREHVTVPRHGRAPAVLVTVVQHQTLERTAEIRSKEDTPAAIRRGLNDLAAGDEISLAQVRDEHAARNP